MDTIDKDWRPWRGSFDIYVNIILTFFEKYEEVIKLVNDSRLIT